MLRLDSPEAEGQTLPPHPPDAGPVIGSLPAFRIDMMRTFLDGWREYGDLVRYRGPRTMCVAAHPDYVRHVFGEHVDSYHRTPFVIKNLRRIMRNGLFMSTGGFWSGQRRLIEPIFQPSHVAGFAPRMVAGVSRMLDRWDASSHPVVDIAWEMTRLDLDILASILFGEDEGGKRAALLPALTAATEYCIPKVMALANPPDAVHPKYPAFRFAMGTLDGMIGQAIADRRREPKDDLVSMFIGARDERTGHQMSDREVRDETLTAMFGAYKGLSHALTWVWYALSKHPAVDRRLRTEVTQVLNGRLPTAGDLSGLSYTTAVVQEVLRLYPSMWALPREAQRDDHFGGYLLPKGVTVVISPYITHRHPMFWDDPSSFDPGRFSPDRSVGRHPQAYVPFGYGPRRCVGEHYALMQLTLVTAMVAQRYRLSLVPGHPIARRREFILRSITPVPVTLERLKSSEPSATVPR